ncbi:hypothetical protein GCM10028803_50370 [Larkinella knui]|uniref:Toll/interleukin-1 receptor domain-containing protein n=1 Tax=Larkinella knui TaxID=2025310 RepID=A0A3P1CQQ8_9BACT|nr:toll/interleukin-1 receptor domain-containing protein [Larkinella knui]RRB15599.1 toll/interleukin-1 receptor domain-containing protein [Larkinella knui]
MKSNKTYTRIELYLSTAVLLLSMSAIMILYLMADKGNSISELFVGLLGAFSGGIVWYIFAQVFIKKTKRKIFLAYSYNDKTFAQLLEEDLLKSSIKVFDQEKGIEVGIDFSESIKVALKEVDDVVVIISKDFYKSGNLEYIISVSKSQNKRIIPFIIDNSKLPQSLYKIKYIDSSKESKRAKEDLTHELLVPVHAYS